jgi:hypothetical protein
MMDFATGLASARRLARAAARSETGQSAVGRERYSEVNRKSVLSCDRSLSRSHSTSSEMQANGPLPVKTKDSRDDVPLFNVTLADSSFSRIVEGSHGSESSNRCNARLVPKVRIETSSRFRNKQKGKRET